MMKENGAAIHCLSFDVEEHFQVSAFWSEARKQRWDYYESRVERNTRIIAEILARHGTKATFFVLGWVAERYPTIVRELASHGHEIASHGYGHELVSSQSPDEFRHDVRSAKRILEDLTGTPVIGYRAPSFSITERSAWALSILVEEGYQYDSSLYDRFGRSGGNTRRESCFAVATTSGPIWEMPPSTLKVLGIEIPVGGGGYFRLFPYAASKACLKRLECNGFTLCLYLHPWEIDPEQPRIDGPWISKFRHYLNLRRTEERLHRLLDDFKFGAIRDRVPSLRTAHHDKADMLIVAADTA